MAVVKTNEVVLPEWVLEYAVAAVKHLDNLRAIDNNARITHVQVVDHEDGDKVIGTIKWFDDDNTARYGYHFIPKAS
jgi:hypothetical protein